MNVKLLKLYARRVKTFFDHIIFGIERGTSGFGGLF
jgi:hypothetical protein